MGMPSIGRHDLGKSKQQISPRQRTFVTGTEPEPSDESRRRRRPLAAEPWSLELSPSKLLVPRALGGVSKLHCSCFFERSDRGHRPGLSRRASGQPEQHQQQLTGQTDRRCHCHCHCHCHCVVDYIIHHTYCCYLLSYRVLRYASRLDHQHDNGWHLTGLHFPPSIDSRRSSSITIPGPTQIVPRATRRLRLRLRLRLRQPRLRQTLE